MDVHPNETDWSLAREIHGQFAQKSGADHIASPFALAHLSAVLRDTHPVNAIEFGAGIGTITSLLLNHPSRVAHVTATEENAFCIGEFARNVGDDGSGRLRLVTDSARLDATERHYDLVVIDGVLAAPLLRVLSRGSICFIEGSRTPTRRSIGDALARRDLVCPFVNYNRGTRYFSFTLRENPAGGRRRPSFRFRRVLKGCWVGRVGPLAAQAAPA